MKTLPKEQAVVNLAIMDFCAYHEMLRTFIIKRVNDPLLAEDLTQEVFIRLLRSPAVFRGQSSQKSWLCAIALNVISDHFRSEQRIPNFTDDNGNLALHPDSNNIEDNLLEKEMASCISGYILSLPERLRAVVALHDIAGLSHQELAPILGISQANSRVLLHRGKNALKKMLQKNCALSFGNDISCEPKGH